MRLSQLLREEYLTLYDQMKIKTYHMIPRMMERVFMSRERYERVEKETGVPWYVVACIHLMEGNGDFSRQIHNGENWKKKTKLVPKGLGPWNTWHESAVEAMHDLNKKMRKQIGENFKWDIPVICYAFESHNGWGYRKYHDHVKSPYLWSYSNHYTSGKYVADGKWSNTAVSKQIGTMVIIKSIQNKLGSIYQPIPKPPVEVQPPKPKPPVKKLTKWQKFKRWFRNLF